jgi:tRNA threonylcarbamoyladenosine biosynthesis protein TsaB
MKRMSEAWLILETSGRVGLVGLAHDGGMRSAALDDSRRHARDLALTIEQLLRDASLQPRDLTGVMVSLGPGSYTGLRVGLASAKALAYATGGKLIAVETFAAIAAQSPPEADQVWVIADALQGQVYHQRFERSGDTTWKAATELRIDLLTDWLAGLTAGVWVSGPGVRTYPDRLPDCRPVPEADRLARVESIHRVGLTLRPLTREEMFAVEPLYLRGSSAEEKARREGKM